MADMESDIIMKALLFACSHHNGVWRKHIKPAEAYICHPIRCADKISEIHFEGENHDEIVAAMFLHDVLEDESGLGDKIMYCQLVAATNVNIAARVREVTNPSKDSHLSRPERKKMDRDHLATVSIPAKIMKLIDRTDNLHQLDLAPLDFRKLYHKESVLLLDALGTVDHPDYGWLREEYVAALDSLTLK